MYNRSFRSRFVGPFPYYDTNTPNVLALDSVQATSNEQEYYELPASQFDDGDFELINQEDLVGYSQDPHPHPRPGSMWRPCMLFMGRQGRHNSFGGLNAPNTHRLDLDHTNNAEETKASSTQVEQDYPAVAEEQQGESSALNEALERYHIEHLEMSLKIEALTSNIDQVGAALGHVRACQQACDRDMRNLQDQLAQGKLPIERSDNLHSLVQGQVHNLMAEVEQGLRAGVLSALDEQVAAYCKTLEDRIAELRNVQQRQANEIRGLQLRLNHIEFIQNRPNDLQRGSDWVTDLRSQAFRSRR